MRSAVAPRIENLESRCAHHRTITGPCPMRADASPRGRAWRVLGAQKCLTCTASKLMTNISMCSPSQRLIWGGGGVAGGGGQRWRGRGDVGGGGGGRWALGHRRGVCHAPNLGVV
eukprot:2158250-Prymnesium_polylepis.1